MEDIIDIGLKALAVLVVLRILGGMAWSFFQSGGETESSRSTIAEQSFSSKAEFERIRDYEQSLRQQGLDEHAIWKQTHAYMAIAYDEINKIRLFNKIFEGFPGGRSKIEQGSPRIPLPDRPLTDKEWKHIKNLAREAAERDVRQGRR